AHAMKLTDDQINSLARELATVGPEGIPLPYVRIVWEDGGSSWIEKSREGQPLGFQLQIRFDVALTSEEMRNRLKQAANFFKPHLTRQVEIINSSGKFKHITRGSYRTTFGENYDPDNPSSTLQPFEMRSRSYAGKESEKFGGHGPTERN